jgi:flavin reductase (DIM6/NTAB) family NADH-FMN oxidoreductase RutF
MLTLKTADLNSAELQNYLQYAIAPRPICFASTIDKAGKINLSPFSFFNLFSSNPPICVFSPARRVRDNTIKHTLENVLEVPECVVNIVSYDMVYQTSLASVEYPKGINEFEKAGFSQLKSDLVRPPRVAESPVQLECFVKQVIPLGENAGAGNLILAEIKLIHIKNEILDADGKIDQKKIDLVARLGGDWYCRVTESNLFRLPKPVSNKSIGVDSLPESIRHSDILTGNNLGQLGNVDHLPSDSEVKEYAKEPGIRGIFQGTEGDQSAREKQLHLKAKELLDEGKVNEAWKTLLIQKIG